MGIRVQRKRPAAYQHGNLREALVQAGLKLLSEGGVETLTLRAAAQLAGVSHAAPYRHFRDKGALVAAVAERGFRLLTTSLRDGLDRCEATDAPGRLLALGLGYVRFATEHPAYLRVIFGGLRSHAHDEPALRQAGTAAYEALRAVVADGLARGQLRGGDADQVALACWSLVHGFSTLLISRAVALPPDERAVTAHLVGLLTTGIRVP